jgi:ketosteroid isomerase-like protein
LEQRGAATNVEGWTNEEARSFFAPEWFSVQPDGSVMRLDAVFARFQEGRSQPWARRFDLTELDIRVYCDTAIVVGLAEARARGGSETSPALHFRYLNVWRKHEGRWLYAGQQSTRF